MNVLFFKYLGRLNLLNWTLILYGTTSDPLERNDHVKSTPVVSKRPETNTTGLESSCSLYNERKSCNIQQNKEIIKHGAFNNQEQNQC